MENRRRRLNAVLELLPNNDRVLDDISDFAEARLCELYDEPTDIDHQVLKSVKRQPDKLIV